MADPIAFIATNKLQKSMLFNTNNNTKVFVLFLYTKPFYAQFFFSVYAQTANLSIQADKYPALLLLLTFVFQVSENLREVVRVRVKLEHFATHAVDDRQTAIPKGILICLHQEGFERVGNLVSHVGVGQVEASEQLGLQLALAGHLARNDLAAQHIEEDHVSWGDESLVLPTLQQEGPVHAAQPQNRIGRREAFQSVAASAQELAQTSQKLAGGSLHDHSFGCASVGRLTHRSSDRGPLRGGGHIGRSFRRGYGAHGRLLSEAGEIGTGLGLLQVLAVEGAHALFILTVARRQLLRAFPLGRSRHDALPRQDIDERLPFQALVLGVFTVLHSCIMCQWGWYFIK